MNYIKKIMILLVFTAFISMPTYALDENAKEAKKVLTLEDCIKYALENHEDIKTAKSMVKIQKSRVGQAKSDYFPRLGFGNSFTYSANKTNGHPTTESSSYGLDLSVNQLIWNFGRTTANINMQKYNQQSSEYDLENEILNITYNVKTAYFAVLAAKANSEISEKTVRINKLNYERTNALFEEGLKSKIDVVNAEVYYTDAQVQLLDAKKQYRTALIDLARAMDYHEAINFSVANTESFNFQPVNYKGPEIDLSKVVTLQDGDNSELVLTSGIEKTNILSDFVFNKYEDTLENAITKAYEQRPDLKSLALVLKASEESLKSVKRSYFPELGASAGYGLGVGEKNTNNTIRISAGLNFPLINAMDIKYRVDEGKAYYDIAEDNLAHAKHMVYYDIQSLYVSMRQLEDRIPLMQKKVEQTLENFELADGRYTVGLGNFIELQDAQTKYNNAQLEFVQVIFKYNVAKEEFYKAMGVQ